MTLQEKLLQEVLVFRKYENCLNRVEYKEYRKYLKKRLLKECTVASLQDFIKDVFDVPELTDTSEATISRIGKLMKADQQARYEREFGEIVPNGRTHLELEPDKFCTKEEFRKEFKKEKFEEYKYIEDLSAEDCANIMLEKYLESYNDVGWLIIEKDKLDKIKKA